MEISILEWLGYLASILIALSMAMSSLVKFRVINLIGAGLFSAYGFLIGSIPVGVMNGFIVLVDVYYLYLFYSKKEVFEVIEAKPDSNYLVRFISFHKQDIKKYFPEFEYCPDDSDVNFFVLRNMTIAGLFLAKRLDNGVLKVDLDYAIPELRDFKSGKFVYNNLKARFLEMGFRKLVANKSSKKHNQYLTKLGFTENSEGMLEKSLS
ncbi:MAG: hypothetical protein RBR30_00995 [Tenuifilaceae bacterium]|jgi:hypothetical protein|nr:hypothetical protein [Tenuifilaceae bacterium]